MPPCVAWCPPAPAAPTPSSPQLLPGRPLHWCACVDSQSYSAGFRGFGAWGAGCRGWDLGFWVLGFGFWIKSLGFRVQGLGFRV